MKRSLFIVWGLLIANLTFAQDSLSRYAELVSKENNDQEVLAFLTRWESNKPDDPDMYIAWFNYYFNLSQQEYLSLSPQMGTGEQLEMKDSLGNTVYLYSQNVTIDSIFELSQHYIDEGIKKHPKRLDMYFGKIHTLRVVGKYDDFLTEIYRVIDLSIENHFDWLWSGDSVIGTDAESVFMASIQQYCNDLFDLNPPAFDPIVAISARMYAKFPTYVEFPSNIGSCWAMQGDYSQAIEFYDRALQIKPDDLVVLNNIAYCYEIVGDAARAIHFYEELAKYGDDETKTYARQKIDQLSQ